MNTTEIEKYLKESEVVLKKVWKVIAEMKARIRKLENSHRNNHLKQR